MAAPPVLTVTLNPALDVTTGIDRVRPQQKLRCSAPRYDPGGGGVNVSRAIRILGGESRAFVALAGATGEHFRSLIARTGIEAIVWPLKGETRFSLNVVEQVTGLHYRFLLPGPEQDRADADRLIGAVVEAIVPGCRFVVASGSVPPGLPADFYAELTRRSRALGVRLILDTSGPHLVAALAERPYIVRLNHLEAQELVGGGIDPAGVAHTASALLARGAAEAVIVTLGEHGAFIASAGGRVHIRPPRVPTVSMVGAGDSFIGALALGLVRDWPVEEAARFGVAAAAAAVSTPAGELCDRETTERYFEATAGMVEHFEDVLAPAG